MARVSRKLWIGLAIALVVVGTLVAFAVGYQSYDSLYDASYVGSAKCIECHTITGDAWQHSPHAKMVRPPTPESVVGNFDDHEWFVPARYRKTARDHEPIARMRHVAGRYYMEFRNPETWEFVPFEIAYVVGYQYRQAYVHLEKGGIYRRLPLQWSTSKNEFFPYWNFQEGSAPSAEDFWMQIFRYRQNSSWNLFCARCHTTKLEVLDKDEEATRATTRWVETSIGCEACHGPGSHHVDYFATNYVNRIAAFVRSKVRGEPVAYIVNPRKLPKGEEVSVCARCHGPDIELEHTEVYREYEPGHSREGRINDLSPYVKSQPITPGRKNPTIEVWDDGRPKGLAMLLRSFVESKCWNEAHVRCYDCHDPHNNKSSVEPGMLVAGPVSDRYCTKCHSEIGAAVEQHTKHKRNTSGAFCYDCHMPRILMNIVSGEVKWTRTHWMSTVPSPENTVRFGKDGAKNACNDCHDDQSAEWAVEWKQKWWPK
ncbi:MAG: hypothetical protein H6832_02610 [Planctomycetes bacterium]|nr:hypothetical protein [Planctomycetota bacterium]MCB9917277.1 hypothetical protein [Planctomycetota bacterium]